MQCPSCRSQLNATLYEGVEIQSCPSCNGTLLTEQNLVAIEKKREKAISREKAHTIQRSYEGSRTCPDCSVTMSKAKYGKYIQKTIDKCPQCHLIWLDEGELEDIQVAYEMYEENTARLK